MSITLTHERLIAPEAIQGLADIIERHNIGKKLMLVCDDTTWMVAGEVIHKHFRDMYEMKPHSLGRHVRATLDLALELATAGEGYDGFIAVGAGTVNDITKYAAAITQKPYVCVATAASMNGYTSANASLEEHGFKHSFAAQPPRAIVADINIIAAAPKRLTRAGLGDTLCRSTVEADMLMSHLLLGTPYPRELFDRLRRHEPDLIAHAPRMRVNDLDYLSRLVAALIDAGDVMTKYGSSAVASQGEHMIAHTADLMYESELRQFHHGEVIAVTTLTMSHLQQKMLLGQPKVRELPREDDQFTRLFGKHNGPILAAQYEKKMLNTEQVVSINERIRTEWPSIKEELQRIMVPTNVIERALMMANTNTHPSEIGLGEERYQSAVTYAYMTRERFTFLDLAAMTGKRST